jgi:vanillate O-demethylase monooxygenase subunit
MEDVVAIEQIQVTFDNCGEARCPEISVKADEPGIRVRRMIADMVQRERNDRAA